MHLWKPQHFNKIWYWKIKINTSYYEAWSIAGYARWLLKRCTVKSTFFLHIWKTIIWKCNNFQQCSPHNASHPGTPIMISALRMNQYWQKNIDSHSHTPHFNTQRMNLYQLPIDAYTHTHWHCSITNQTLILLGNHMWASTYSLFSTVFAFSTLIIAARNVCAIHYYHCY